MMKFLESPRLRKMLVFCACLAMVALAPTLAMAQTTTMPVPVMSTTEKADLQGWITGFFSLALTVLFYIVNAGIVFWFIKMAVKRIWRQGRA